MLIFAEIMITPHTIVDQNINILSKRKRTKYLTGSLTLTVVP